MCRPSRSTGLSGGQRYQSLSHLIKEIDLLAVQKLAEIAFPPPKHGGRGGRVMYVCVRAREESVHVCARRLRATEGCMDFSCLAA